MLEKPGLSDARIMDCLRVEYGLAPRQVAFLPWGVDQNAAVYHVTAEGGKRFFLKLRSGGVSEIGVALPDFLRAHGIQPIIAPLKTQSGQLWTRLDDHAVTLYPFVEGADGYELGLTDRQWCELGAALKQVHSVALPAGLRKGIRQESYSPVWRQQATWFAENFERINQDDPIAAGLAAILVAHQELILDLVRWAARLAQRLQAVPRPFVLCHGDLHAGNILMGTQEAFYLVDWDDPIMAPRERDLMSMGAGLMGDWRTPQEEEDLFYRGYGQIQIDPEALAYYRYERIVVDIAEFCQQIVRRQAGSEDRNQALQYLESNFRSGGTIEIARHSDRNKDWQENGMS